MDNQIINAQYHYDNLLPDESNYDWECYVEQELSKCNTDEKITQREQELIIEKLVNNYY